MTLVRCVAARSQASRPASAACSELIAIAFIRYRFMGGKLANTIVQVVSAAASCFTIGGLARPDRCSAESASR